MATTSKRNPVDAFLFSFFFISYYLSLLSHAADNTITQGQNLSDGQTLISEDQIFQLGFFSPASSSLRYVGIRYYNIQEKEPSVIWVANREKPLFDKKGVLRFKEDGNLMIVAGNNTEVWSSNASIVSANTTARLDDTGNLILSSNDSKKHWESFNDPTDTFLPGMRVQVNAEMGENRAFTSWKSASDPSPGNYSMGVDPQASPQIVIWEGEHRRWRSGYWDGRMFSGVPNITSSYMYGFKLSDLENQSRYFTYTPMTSSDKLRFRIRWEGYEEQLRWEEGGSKWDTIQSQPADKDCELYNFCGNFGLCNELNSPVCSCMQGFVPMDPDQWYKGNWSGGCTRRTELQCQRNLSSVTQETAGEDGFVDVKCSKLPDFATLEAIPPGSNETCESKCLNNCSCTAYADASGIGCLIWKGNLLDVHQFPRAGNTLKIRLADSELGGKRKLSILVIIIIVVAGVVLLVVFTFLLWRFKTKRKVLATVSSISGGNDNDTPLRTYESSKSMEFSTDLSGRADLSIDGDQANGLELPLFNFNFVAFATNNFSEENKLGEGGFGPVYKGKLPGGQEIAVKRLSVRSCQGLEEFKNEIILIAKLQHRNLVRLLGCSIQGEEKMLLYEYMPNKSLDCFLFDPSKQALLDWRKRFTIIEGIARGLLYLHRDSRLRIIHRDLKASNILLDEEMNPKISDFGMARIFGGNQHEANTNRVVGTFGYMSPEYAMEGLFSVKSDVYSFGVLLLEIVSGRKNTSFRLSEYASLIGHAWHLWNEEKAMELIDPSIRDSCSRDEVLRCIHLGMLCVQDSAAQRPTMSSVVLMLESEGATLPLPRQPTFTSMRESSIDTESYMECQDIVSSNDLTVTMICGR
ncbi:G-type lectin S-receptor-like serine/threonine-protein kinase B120 isoform X1 [Castanea sativa]|uniref:G-type lectin S-receptor-like serine/threonine-protein kinase B120 isoform X1 n=1 Tax=Castanea sativa TaxID=21020 RepID=UPI003F6540A3